NYPITTPPPTLAEIDALINAKPSTDDIDERRDQFGETLIRTNNPSIGLDFSGLAKGAAAGLACDVLAKAGFQDALVNLGGDVLVCGATSAPWRVAIKDPRAGVLEVLEVSERLAVFTSGQYYRYGEWDGERYAHVLNPATGYPIEHILQATAIHPDPVLADAAATALVVAGFDQAKELGQTLGLEQWLLVDEAGDQLWMRPN
ncbi:MAG TPA: FAD:protein FMN transferase, partial [Wenzhouxiangella sp.]